MSQVGVQVPVVLPLPTTVSRYDGKVHHTMMTTTTTTTATTILTLKMLFQSPSQLLL